jgi:hypothetical protein
MPIPCHPFDGMNCLQGIWIPWKGEWSVTPPLEIISLFRAYLSIRLER